jgi:hypothetical protein
MARITRRPRILAYPAGRRAEIASTTGPLAMLAGKKVVVLADLENWVYSARSLGAKVSFGRLGELIRLVSRSCGLHAFFSRMPGDEGRSRYLAERGWCPHPNDIEVVATCRGRERRANCDNFLLFMAGVLASRSEAEVIVIGSGDGRLAGELARALLSLPKKRQVVTLSLAGSTASCLNASANPSIAGNIEIGRDCLRKA